MSDQISLSIDQATNGILKSMNQMLDRANTIQGWLNRVAYPKLIAATRKRWETEGASQGEKWKPLNGDYAKYKLTKYRDYPGSGSKMLVATAALVQSMTGDNQENHWKLVTNRSLEFGSTLGYAKYVDDLRDFTSLNEETTDELLDELGKYLAGNK